MERKTAHNIAASLILPERELASEISIRKTGNVFPDTESNAIMHKAMRAARQAIEDTITDEKYPVLTITGPDAGMDIKDTVDATEFVRTKTCTVSINVFDTEAEQNAYIEAYERFTAFSGILNNDTAVFKNDAAVTVWTYCKTHNIPINS